MKKLFAFFGILVGTAFLVLVVYLAAHNITVPGDNSYINKDITVVKIYEGGVKDIVFEEADGSFYYINRGLEQGFTLEGMREQLLNKTVTLHLTKKLAGVSSHINRMKLGEEIIYTEFDNTSSL